MEETKQIKKMIKLIDDRCKYLVNICTENNKFSSDYMAVSDYINSLLNMKEFLIIINSFLKVILEYFEAFERGAEDSALL